METIKALIIDNNILERQVFSNVLKSFSDVDVRLLSEFDEPYSVIEKEDFDVIFLDVQESNSISTIDLEILRSKYPSLSVVAIAKRTREGAVSILKALNRGAVDFVTKPEENNMLLLAKNHLKKRLGLIIGSLKELRSGKRGQIKLRSIRKTKGQKPGIIVIGTGSEGIRTLYKVLKRLPENLSVPVIVVAHLPKMFTRVLAESLNQVSKLKVIEAVDGDALRNGTVCIVPCGFHAEVIRGDREYLLRLHRGPKENEERPSIDVVFRSISRIFREKTLGVMLSGYRKDGFVGAQFLKEYGGEILIQQPDSLFAGALLNDIYDAGLCDHVYSEEFLSWEIVKRAHLEKSITKKGFMTVSVART